MGFQFIHSAWIVAEVCSTDVYELAPTYLVDIRIRTKLWQYPMDLQKNGLVQLFPRAWRSGEAGVVNFQNFQEIIRKWFLFTALLHSTLQSYTSPWTWRDGIKDLYRKTGRLHGFSLRQIHDYSLKLAFAVKLLFLACDVCSEVSCSIIWKVALIKFIQIWKYWRKMECFWTVQSLKSTITRLDFKEVRQKLRQHQNFEFC